VDFIPENRDSVPADVRGISFKVKFGEALEAVEGVGRGGPVAACEGPVAGLS
jgi:hypothetical protein